MENDGLIPKKVYYCTYIWGPGRHESSPYELQAKYFAFGRLRICLGTPWCFLALGHPQPSIQAKFDSIGATILAAHARSCCVVLGWCIAC